MTIPLLIAAAMWLAQQAQQTPLPPRVATVDGSVVNTVTGRGIPGARVILRSEDTGQGTSYAEETDSNGHFRINDVAPGEYSITAERQKFFPHPDGAPGAPPPRLTVSAAAQVANLVVKLSPTGVIAGRIFDQDGDPIRGVSVHAMQYANVGGRRQLRSVVQAQSKDNGEYRLFGLRPGSYRLQVTSRATRPAWAEPAEIRGPHAPMGYATTFFPGVVDPAKAVPVELKAGAELHGFDITVPVSEAGYSIRVKYTGADEVSIEPALWPLAGDGTGFGQLMTFGGHGPDGGFMVFAGVLPGSYLLSLKRTEGGESTFASQQVDVSDSDLELGPLAFSPAADIRGTLKIEGKPTLPNLRLSLQPAATPYAASFSAEIKPDGSFEWKDVPPNAYQVVLFESGDYYLKSVRVGDQDLRDGRLDLLRGERGPLVIVLGSDVGRIEGPVVLADGTPAARVRVTLFPDGAYSDRPELFRVAFTDDHGNFHLNRVVPGDYRLFAWLDVQPGEPQDPELRKKFEKQSVPVKIGPNGHGAVPLTAIRTRTEDPR